jgi:hypothetical protein
MKKFLLAAGGAAALLAGCAYDEPYTPQGTTATSVTRDYWGNPVGSTTVVRDAWGNPVAARSSGGYAAPGTVYSSPPVYSGSSMPPATVVRPETQVERDRRAAQDPDCRATLLHQDRPGGSNYDPRRGAPSC